MKEELISLGKAFLVCTVAVVTGLFIYQAIQARKGIKVEPALEAEVIEE